MRWLFIVITFISCSSFLNPLFSIEDQPQFSSYAEPVEKIPTASDTLKIDYSANFQSRHIWRGTLTCDSWNIQPTINVSNKNFLMGAWAAYTLNNSYAEVDLYIAYTIKNFTVALLNYFCPDETQVFNRLFDFNQSTTQHTLDLTMSYEGPKKFPIRFMASTLIWGDDLNPSNGDNYFSSYIESGFYWNRNQNQEFDFHLGVSPFKGYYANSFNVVSIGSSITQNINITKEFSMPIFGKLIVNPHTENIFFVFGLSLSVK